MVVPVLGFSWRDTAASWLLSLVAAGMITLAVVGGRLECRTILVTSVWNWGLAAGCRAIAATSVVGWLLSEGRPILAAQGVLTAAGVFAAWRGFYSNVYWVAVVGVSTTVLAMGLVLTDLFWALRREVGLVLACQLSSLLAVACFIPACWLELRLVGSRMGQPPGFGRPPSFEIRPNDAEFDKDV
jgi:hypothetical protein